ncbi:P-II family nitrogen regulator [Desulfovibrio sp. TomC]|uniref:P-II family nitrogen regulator n=1 Tax=Desulfovibrio sp. TomC TaxID=1562888 RepID=UPI000574EDF5|nr:P-II family nitrogen regulator [Desulfovibrio sp. TomC]KHK03593.1 Nitrogen regulatory protein P-II [Desulfovibrio sp. TomC]
MKRIEAIIRPSQLEAVEAKLTELGVGGMTVDAVQGFGRQRCHEGACREAASTADFESKIKITLVAEASRVAELAAAIREAAWTGQVGDGKIFVVNMGEAVRIRTGEAGASAI